MAAFSIYIPEIATHKLSGGYYNIHGRTADEAVDNFLQSKFTNWSLCHVDRESAIPRYMLVHKRSSRSFGISPIQF